MNVAPEAPSSIVKQCGCGRTFTREGWDRLEFVGRQHVPEDEFGPEISIELRNCPCGSTIAIDCK